MEFNPVIDKNKPEPVYQQIKEQLLKLIRQDNLPPGTLMPSVKLVAAASGVSLRTADQAMQALVDEGICFRRPKKGTFVSGHGLGGGQTALRHLVYPQPEQHASGFIDFPALSGNFRRRCRKTV